MYKTIGWLVTALCWCNLLFAQEKPYKEPSGTNNWFVELGGSAFFYSLNYEKLLNKNDRWGWIGRIGAAYNPVQYTLLNKVTLGDHAFLFPFTTSLLYGKRKERLELGGGVTLITTGINNREVAFTGLVGFRVIETNKVYFRVNYTPFIRNGVYTHWYGVSLGRNFSLK